MLYTKPELTPEDPGAGFALIERELFGTLVTPGPDGIAISHLTFLLERGEGAHGTLVSHLALANDHAALVRAGIPSAVIFMGRHNYISSSWYPAPRDSAPTWNFVTVHCHGAPQPLDEAATARHIRDLVEVLEEGREDRWRLKELGGDGFKRRLGVILGFRLPIGRMDVKFKLGQDERLRDTNAAINRLEQGIDPELAALMCTQNADRKPPVSMIPAPEASDPPEGAGSLRPAGNP